MEDEASYGIQRTRTAPEDEYPLAEVSLAALLHVKTHAPMPAKAMARLAVRELRRLAGEIEVRQLKPTAKGNGAKDGVLGDAGAKPPPAPEKVADFSGLDKRVVKTAFRILDLVAKEDSEGREALVSGLAKEVSPPTLARFLDASEPAGKAVAGWFQAEKRGRTKAILLTEEGRRVARSRVVLAAKA